MDVNLTCTHVNEREMNELTGRLQTYMYKVREMRSSGGSASMDSFRQSMEAMECEMSHLKSMYEGEITKLRQQLGECCRGKGLLQLQISKLEAATAEFEIRIAAEMNKSRQMNESVSAMRLTLQQKEQEYQAMAQQHQRQQSMYSTTGTNAGGDGDGGLKLELTLKANVDLKQKYESQMFLRTQAEERVFQLEQQLGFCEGVCKQQAQDWQMRLNAANCTISSMESKVSTFSSADYETNIAAMLAGVKEAANRELCVYKHEVEAMLSKDVTTMSSQMETERKSYAAISTEKKKLQTTIDGLNLKIRGLEAQIAYLEQTRESSEVSIVEERERASRQVQVMETKLKEWHEMMFGKMKELNTARILNVPLKAQIDSIRVLVSEEERRISLDTKLPAITSHRHHQTACTRMASQQCCKRDTRAITMGGTTGCAAKSQSARRQVDRRGCCNS